MTLLCIEASEVYHKFVKRLAWFFKKVRLLLVDMSREQNQNRFKQNTEKFRELVLYISSQWKDAEYSGETKLNKVLWAIDTTAYDRLGSPVTGARYKRGEFGPRAYPYPPIIGDMTAEGILEIQLEEVSGHTQHRPIAKRPPNMSLFSPEEKAIIDKWVAEFKDKSATWVKKWSHDESVGWQVLKEGQDIPHYCIYWGPTKKLPVTSKEKRRLGKLAERLKGQSLQ